MTENIFEKLSEQNEEKDRWQEVASQIENFLETHDGKPEHLNWTLNMLKTGADIEKVKANYLSQRDKLGSEYDEIKEVLDKEFGE